MGTLTLSRIVIIGNGLIGGSIELALRDAAVTDVVALDRGADLSAVTSADLVVLAAPVQANIALLPEIRAVLRPSAVVTDVSSTKAAICAAADGLRFVGGHPIAGAADGGRANARADLFRGRPWILVRCPAASDADAASVEALVRAVGAVPHPMDAAEHDRLFAYLSHLPQLTISALMDVVGREVMSESLSLAGPGLRDITRLASSPADVWVDIAATNRPAVHAALDALIDTLIRIRDDEGGEALRQVFTRAAATRRTLERSKVERGL